MFFSKQIPELEYSDVHVLVASGEPESLFLDYKEMINGAERDKAELAKDASALANSQGGYLIIGVEEQRGKPVSPPVGIPTEIRGQKAEEWVEQVLLANISPRLAIHIRPLAIPETERQVLVIHIPMSARAPHMVTFQGDNRYYRRIFKRHQFQSLPAEEYEVREMYERSLRLYDQVQRLLDRKGYGDPESSSFGGNTWSERLGMRYIGEDGTKSYDTANAWVAFVACPNILTEDAIDTGSERFWAWLEPNLRKYMPRPSRIFLPYQERRTVLEGAIRLDRTEQLIDRYLLISRNGFVEFAIDCATWIEKDALYFPFISMMGLFWQFVGFVADVYQTFGLLGGFRLILNMKNTKDSLLRNLAKGWLEPRDRGERIYYRPVCTEKNIQIIRELPSPALDDAAMAQLVKDFATRVDNAYGNVTPRCYNLKRDDPQESFPADEMGY